ncbi:MAG: hypothetical protein WC061_03480 [Melioribacteraceae bacterium]
MTKLLSRQDIINLLEMTDAINILENAFADLSEGRAILPVRTSIPVPDHNGSALYMPAYLSGPGALGIKVVTVYQENMKRYGLPTISGTIILMDEKSGIPIAVMEGSYLTAVRTGAVSGLATKLLSRKESKVHALFGTGGMSRAHALAIDSVRNIEKIIVFSLDPVEIRNEFKHSLEQIVKSEIIIAGSAEEAARGADIVTLITTSKRPVIDGNWISPGTHINGAGSHEPFSREIDTKTVVRSKIICDLLEACKTEAGDLIIPVEEKMWGWEKVHASLGDLITKKKTARESSEEITLFKTVGLAIQDLSVAQHVYNKSVELNAGTNFNF